MERRGHLYRTRYDPNEFIFESHDCKIVLFNEHGDRTGIALIDSEDFPLIKNQKWYLNSNGYVMTRFKQGNKKRVHLTIHSIILGRPDSYIDHEDDNPLNNKKSNLRICTQSQNTANKRKQSNNTSGFKGVSWHKTRSKWRASIRFEYKQYHLGLFKSKGEAAFVYNAAAEKLHGEFARLNKVF